MEQFLADATLIYILVLIGSYTNQQRSGDTRNLVQEQVESSESDVAQNRVVKARNDLIALKDTEENRASQLAGSSSEATISTMKGCVQMSSDVFDGLLHQLSYLGGKQFVEVDANKHMARYNAY